MHISDLSKAGIFLYKIGVFKNRIFYPDFAPDEKCSELLIRVVHPVGLIVFVVYLLGSSFTEGVPETYRGIRKAFCII